MHNFDLILFLAWTNDFANIVVGDSVKEISIESKSHNNNNNTKNDFNITKYFYSHESNCNDCEHMILKYLQTSLSN